MVCECPEFDKEALVVAYYVVVGAGVALGVRQMEEKLGRRLGESELELSSWAMATIGACELAPRESTPSTSTSFISRPGKWLFFEKVDVLVTPTAAMPPVKIGAFCIERSGSISDLSAAKNEVSFLDRQSTRP